MNNDVGLAILVLMVIGWGGYMVVDTTLDSPPVVYRTAAVDEVGVVPNKKQEAACADLAAGPEGTPHGPIRQVAGTVLSDPLHGAVGTSQPDLELARDKLNLAVALPGQDLPLLVHGIPVHLPDAELRRRLEDDHRLLARVDRVRRLITREE